MTDITEGIPLSLSTTSAESVDSWTNTDVSYEWAIGGLPFLAATSDQHLLRRAFAQQRKDQVDTSTEPGEQAFSTWWVRSQGDFSSGAGRDIMDPGGDKTALYRFRNSQGVDVSSGTKVTLVNTLELEGGTSGTGSVVPWSTASVAAASGTTVGVYPSGSTATATGTINDIAVLSGKVWCAQQDSKLVPFNGTSLGTVITAPGAVTKVWTAKQRLICVVGTSLYEVGLGATTFPTALTDGGTNWTWTGVGETSDMILAAGHDGVRSAVYGFTISETTGSLPTLTAPSVVAEFPAGELVTSMVSYLGSFIIFGTSRGVRVGSVNASAASRAVISYGPVIVETTQAVAAITCVDRYAYCGVTAGLPDGNSGLIKVDLSTPVDDAGRFAYTFDKTVGTTDTINDVCPVGNTAKVAVWADGLYLESSTKVASGWLETGQIRFATLENKFFDLLKLRGTPDGGTIAVESVDMDSDVVGLGSMGDSDAPTLELAIYPRTPQVRLGFKFTLSSDGTQDPQLLSYQVKALPAVRREELWEIPLMCFDSEKDRFGVPTSTGPAHARYTALREVAAVGGRVMVQDLSSGESTLAMVEGVRFDQRKPPARADGFGGILTVTVRCLT